MLLDILFLVILWMLALYLIYGILVGCNLCCKVPQKMIKTLKNLLFFKQWVVFTYATFLELLIVVILQALIVEDDWHATDWVLLSFILWIFVIVLLAFIFFITFCIVCR